MANEKRLIDANEAFEIVTDLAGQADTKGAYKAFWTAARAIQKMPTVDAVEVIHAEWLDGCAIRNGKEVYKSIDCSNCEEVFKIESETPEYWKERFKVCPFCSAKMDGERRE